MYRTSVKLRIKKEQYLVAHQIFVNVYTKVMHAKEIPIFEDMILAEYAEKRVSSVMYRMWVDRPVNKLYVWQLPTSVAVILFARIKVIDNEMRFEDPAKTVLIGIGSKLSIALQGIIH
jgi:hypothetical protein